MTVDIFKTPVGPFALSSILGLMVGAGGVSAALDDKMSDLLWFMTGDWLHGCKHNINIQRSASEVCVPSLRAQFADVAHATQAAAAQGIIREMRQWGGSFNFRRSCPEKGVELFERLVKPLAARFGELHTVKPLEKGIWRPTGELLGEMQDPPISAGRRSMEFRVGVLVA